MLAVIGTVASAMVVSTLAVGPATLAEAGAATTASRGVADELAGQATSALTLLQAYRSTGSWDALAAYSRSREAIAAVVGSRLEIDPDRLESAWASADVTHQEALMAAFTQLGVPYRRNTSKAGIGFDCSGLTTYAWSVAGVALTRSSRTQIRAAATRTATTAQAGDLAYYPGHVMMWLGVDNAIVHAPQTGQVVSVDFFATRRAKSIQFGNPIA